jgi:hypothetical protein
MTTDPKRKAMTSRRKRDIWEREEGLCRICKLPVPMLGPEVIYDHDLTLFITGDDADAGVFPLHREPCNRIKTSGDLTRIAKTKRQMKMAVGAERKPSRMKSRPFSNHHRPFPKGRGFQKRPHH